MTNITNVEAAIDLLLEAVESELKAMQRNGADALASGQYDQANDWIRRAQSFEQTRQKIIGIEEEIRKQVSPTTSRANGDQPQRYRRPIPVLDTLSHAQFVELRKKGMSNEEIVRLYGRSGKSQESELQRV